MNLFQVIFVPICAAVCLLTLVRGLRRQLGLRQSLFWVAIWAAAAMLIMAPGVASVVASWLGIGRGTDLVTYAAVLAGTAACLYFYQRYRRLEVLCTELIRREAIRQAIQGQPSPAEPTSQVSRQG